MRRLLGFYSRDKRERLHPALAYLLAFLSAGVAVALTGTMPNPLFPTPLFFAAIVVSTWYGGIVSGGVTVLLAIAFLDYYYIPPVSSSGLGKPSLVDLLDFALPALVTCWFVSRRKIAEDELRDARDVLQSRIEERQAELARVARIMSVDEMGVSIAHEVNQPLMGVVLHGDACLRWLNADPPNLERARTAVERIIDEGTRAGEIVKRLRNLSAKTPPNRTALDLNELVNETAATLERTAVRNGIAIRTDLQERLPLVKGDRVQLQQVLVNLTMNGIEAMSGAARGPREINIRSETDGRDGVSVTVEDCGPGLPDGDPERLFTAFFTTKKHGLGIGLSISRTIVESHGGRLWAANSDRGAVFHFRLPVLAARSNG